jgi:hypothetical protein
MITSTISGLPISTNTDSTIAAGIWRRSSAEVQLAAELDEEEQQQEVPQRREREPIASRYGVEASANPARNAPTSVLNPSQSLTAATATAQATANTSSSS